jgi:hypothetical protein
VPAKNNAAPFGVSEQFGDSWIVRLLLTVAKTDWIGPPEAATPPAGDLDAYRKGAS